jgi:hypothetical protein
MKIDEIYKILNVPSEWAKEKEYYSRVWDFDVLSLSEIKKIVKQDLQTFDCTKLVLFVRDHVIPEMFYDEEPNSNIPSGIHLPSKNLALYIDEFPWIFFLFQNQNNVHEFYMFNREQDFRNKPSTRFSARGYFNFKTSKYYKRKIIGFRDGDKIIEEEISQGKATINSSEKFVIAMIAAITNQNITTYQPLGNRKEKRRLKSEYQVENVKFGQISWNINGSNLSSKSKDDPQYHLPLHWRRGYWRRAEEEHPKSEMRPHAINPEDRQKWWTWIEGYWAGHPAFGFKRSIYQPKVGEKKWLEQLK